MEIKHTFFWLNRPALLLPAVLFCIFCWSGEGQNEVSSNTGWISLFDGKTTTGWRGFNKAGFPQKGWEVKNDCLHVFPHGGGGDILTEQQFDNFEFAWEWQISSNGNSGVKYLILEEHGAAVGPEYQMLDDRHNREGIKDSKWSTASLYDVMGNHDVKLKPLNEFNQSRIVLQGKHVEHWLNGVKVLEFELDSEALKKAIAKSKFRSVPYYGVKSKGHILLQDHGYEVWFRNLKIRELPAP